MGTWHGYEQHPDGLPAPDPQCGQVWRWIKQWNDIRGDGRRRPGMEDMIVEVSRYAGDKVRTAPTGACLEAVVESALMGPDGAGIALVVHPQSGTMIAFGSDGYAVFDRSVYLEKP